MKLQKGTQNEIRTDSQKSDQKSNYCEIGFFISPFYMQESNFIHIITYII